MQTTTIIAPQVSQAVGTSATAIGGYSPPASSGAIVSSIVLANITGSTITATVDLYNGSVATRLVVNAPIAANDCLVLGGSTVKILLVTGWSIRVTSNTASSIDASMSVTQFT